MPRKVRPDGCDRPDHQVPVLEVAHALTAGFAQVNAAVAAGVVEVPLVVMVPTAVRIV